MRNYQQLPTIYYVHDRSITPRSPTPGLAPKLGVFRLSSKVIFCEPKAWVEGAVPICQQLQISGLPETLGWFQINLSRKHGQRAVLQFFLSNSGSGRNYRDISSVLVNQPVHSLKCIHLTQLYLQNVEYNHYSQTCRPTHQTKFLNCYRHKQRQPFTHHDPSIALAACCSSKILWAAPGQKASFEQVKP